jgi:hypothetical protein
MPYQTTLPECFPYALRAPSHSVENIIDMLVKGGPGHPNGSSFAVTSDAPRGYRTLWLSEASYQTLIAAHIVPGTFDVTSTSQESFADFVLDGGNPAAYGGETPGVADWAEVNRRKHGAR